MGQTLTHGIYLPDEGERNCYNGLAANWQLLDGAVGTIAEHTTQITGKAPLVHTHTKSDVTDLFNSANTWSGENTYTATIKYKTSYTLGNPPHSTDAQSAVMITDSAGTNYLAQIATYQNIATTGCRITVRDKFDSNGFSPSGSNRNKHFYFLQSIANQGFLQWDGYANNSIYPLTDNTYNLGTSTNKWKTLNGINPGALSLPDVTDGDPISTIGWSLTGSRNTYTPKENGWFFIRIKGTASAKCSLNIHSGSYNDNYPTWVSYNDPTISLSTSLVVPAQKAVNLYVYIIAAEIEQLIFFPCLGNV